MAIVTITYETKNKDLSVLVDGVVVDDVRAIYVYKDNENYGGYSEYGSIEIVKETKLDNGLRVSTRIVGSETKEGQKSKALDRRFAAADNSLIYSFDDKQIADLL